MERILAFWRRTKPHMVWVVTAAVLILYFCGWLFHYFTNLDWLATILTQAATAVLVSGVFASLLKSYQFSELFKDELKGFFTEADMIKKMREISIFGRTGDDVIHKAMEHLLVMTNSDLCTSFTKSSPRLLRVKHDYSLLNFEREITLLDYDPTTGKIKVRDVMTTSLLVSSNTRFTTSSVGEGFEDRNVLSAVTLATNGGPAEDLKDKAIVKDGTMKIEFALIAGNDYRFTRVLDQEYVLRKDPIIQQEFVRFCEGMVLKVINEVPEKLDFTVRFLNFSDQIVPHVLPAANGTKIQKTYSLEYLTFPFQAFIVTLTHKP